MDMMEIDRLLNVILEHNALIKELVVILEHNALIKELIEGRCNAEFEVERLRAGRDALRVKVMELEKELERKK